MGETKVVSDVAVVPPEEVAKRVICLLLSFSSFGIRRKVDPRKVVAAPAEAMASDAADAVHVGKDILQCDALLDIKRLSYEARAFVVGEAVPARFLRGGMHLVPAMRLEQIEQRLSTLRDMHSTLVDGFVQEYESGSVQAEARRRLEPLGLYDARDYPAAATVKASFRMTWRWLEFSVPDKLRETNPALWAAEMAKAREMWAEAAAEITSGLREGIAEIVRRLATKLEPGDDGKRKALRSDTFEALDEFLSAFPFKDVTGDAELRAEVEKLKALRRGVDVDDLKKYGAIKEKLRKELVAVGSRLEQLVEEAPERRISFEDDAA